MSFKPDIDPRNGKIDAPIDLGGEPEFLASDGAGKVYINLMDKNEVAVVDFKARKVVARWPVAPGGAPVGMAIDTTKRPPLHRVPKAPEVDRDEHRKTARCCRTCRSARASTRSKSTMARRSPAAATARSPSPARRRLENSRSCRP